MRERIRARASYGSDALVYGSHVAGGAVILAASCQLIGPPGHNRMRSSPADLRGLAESSWERSAS